MNKIETALLVLVCSIIIISFNTIGYSYDEGTFWKVVFSDPHRFDHIKEYGEPGYEEERQQRWLDQNPSYPDEKLKDVKTEEEAMRTIQLDALEKASGCDNFGKELCFKVSISDSMK